VGRNDVEAARRDRGKDVAKKMKVKDMRREEMEKALKATSDWVTKSTKNDAKK
jgi:hypothetical protein